MSPAAGIAILGSGIFAKEAHVPALAVLGGAAPPLIAVYSRSETSARDLANIAATSLHLDKPPAIYHDGDQGANLDALLARTDITAVIVVLPITVQPSIILKALAAGKHVLSEKPVAADVRGGLDLINEYNQSYKPKGLIWRVAENFEAEPGIRAAESVVQSGKIGKVIFFKITNVSYVDKESKWYKTPWRTVPDYQGGFLLDAGVHFVAALRVIVPNSLTHLSASASLNREHLKPHDTIHAVARAGDHFHGIVELSWGSPTKSSPTTDTIVITGTDGWVSAKQIYPQDGTPAFLRIRIVQAVHHDGKPSEEKEEIVEIPSSGVPTELSSFFNAIAGKDDGLNLGDPFAALTDVAFIQAALNSNGSPVDLAKLLQDG